jgi:hypothetical protein
MIEASLSLVVGFAVYTAYVIVGDEIRSNRTKPQSPLKLPVSPKSSGKPAAKAPKPVARPSAKPSPSKAIKAKTPADPIANTAKAIMANLTKNGPTTVAKLTKELNTDAATMQLATEKLINDKKVTSIKRSGHPALALNN